MTTTSIINRFNGYYAFLSSFFPNTIHYRGIDYPSREHAFQAQKTDQPHEKKWITESPTPAVAKQRGRSVTLVSDWLIYRRYSTMEDLISIQYAPGSVLAQALINTSPAPLIEGNTWHDNLWGVCLCGRCTDGLNLLGWMLMRQRAYLITSLRIAVDH